MDLAVRTTASPAAIWTIVIVAVVLLAFWLIMVMVYATRPDPRYRRLAVMPGPVLGGIHMAAGGRSVSPTRDAPAEFGEDFVTDLAAERPEPAGAEAPAPEAAEIPAQRAAHADTPASAGTTAGGTTPTDAAGSGAGGSGNP